MIAAEFARIVEFQDTLDGDILHIKARFTLTQYGRVTTALVIANPEAKKEIKEMLVRTMFRELYSKHRGEFYELINELKANIPGPLTREFFETLDKLKSLVD